MLKGLIPPLPEPSVCVQRCWFLKVLAVSAQACRNLDRWRSVDIGSHTQALKATGHPALGSSFTLDHSCAPAADMLSRSSLILLHAWRCQQFNRLQAQIHLTMAPTMQVQRQAAASVILRHHGVTTFPAQRGQRSTPLAPFLRRQDKPQGALVIHKARPSRRLATAAVVAKAGGEVLVAGASWNPLYTHNSYLL